MNCPAARDIIKFIIEKYALFITEVMYAHALVERTLTMENAPKYSVIIPVYNGERTLRRCLDSLLNQNYRDAQIILVDDGSTDESGSICGEYCRAFQQVKYISRPHTGVSEARNAGLDVAEGRYILFVDSDDMVEGDYFARLEELDRLGPCDFLWFSYSQTGNGRKSLKKYRSEFTDNPDRCADIFGHALGRKTLNPLWNKRYSSAIIGENGLRFLEGLSIGEDKLFNLQYAMHSGSLRISDTVIYKASVENRQSLSRKRRDDLQQQFALLDAAIADTIRHTAMEESGRMCYLEAQNFTVLRSVYSDAKRMHLDGRRIVQRRKWLRQRCGEINSLVGRIPEEFMPRMLRLPVRLRLVSVIDLVGYLLARNLIHY